MVYQQHTQRHLNTQRAHVIVPSSSSTPPLSSCEAPWVYKKKNTPHQQCVGAPRQPLGPLASRRIPCNSSSSSVGSRPQPTLINHAALSQLFALRPLGFKAVRCTNSTPSLPCRFQFPCFLFFIPQPQGFNPAREQLLTPPGLLLPCLGPVQAALALP